MSSLADQLKKLAARPQFRGGKERPSLLFEGRQAAELDLDTVYELAVNGLAELRTHNEAFEQYEDSLFSLRHKGTERLQLTAAENKDLSEQIANYCRLLSPYFLLKAAQKTVEYLIRRFRVEEFNVHELMELSFLYHETTVFVRLVRICDLTAPANKQWAWLASVQKSELPLDRHAVVQRCLGDLWLVDFVGRMAASALRSNMRHAPQVAFWASIVTGVLEAAPKVSEALVGRLLPSIMDGLKSGHTEHSTAAYMVVSTAALRTSFSPDLTATLSDAIVTGASADGCGPALLCLAYVAQTQPLRTLSAKAFKALLAMHGLVEHLSGLASTYGIASLLQLVVDGLLSSLPSSECMTVAQSMAATVPLSQPLATRFVEGVLSAYVKATKGREEGERSESEDEVWKALLTTLATRYPEAMDEAVGKALGAKEEGEEGEGKKRKKGSKTVFALVSQCFQGTRHQPNKKSNTTLFMSLIHPDFNIRAAAVTQLQDLAGGDGPTLAFACDSLLARLKDDHPSVTFAALDVVPHFVDHLDKETLFDSLVAILGSKSSTPAATQRAVQVLGGCYLTSHPSMAPLCAPYLFALLLPTLSGGPINHTTVGVVRTSPALSALPYFTKLNDAIEKELAQLAAPAQANGTVEEGKKKSKKKEADGERQEDKENGVDCVGAATQLVDLVGQAVLASEDPALVLADMIGWLAPSCRGNPRESSLFVHLVVFVHLVGLWLVAHVPAMEAKARIAEALLRAASSELTVLLPQTGDWRPASRPSAEMGRVPTPLLDALLSTIGSTSRGPIPVTSLLAVVVQETVHLLTSSAPAKADLPAPAASALLQAITLTCGPLGSSIHVGTLLAGMFRGVGSRDQLHLLLLALMGPQPDSTQSSPIVMVHVLQVARAFLTACQSAAGTVVTSQSNPLLGGAVALLVPALLVALQSPIASVRQAALGCVGVLTKIPAPLLEYTPPVVGGSGAEALFFADSTTLAAVKGSQLSKFIGVLHERASELAGDGSHVTTLLERHLNDANSRKYAEALAVFFSAYALSLCDGQRRNDLLQLVSVYKDTTALLPLAMPLFKSQLAAVKQAGPAAKAARGSGYGVSVQTLDIVLGWYRPGAAPSIVQGPCIENLVEALRGGPVQLTALKLVTPHLFSEVGKKAQKTLIAALCDVLGTPRNSQGVVQAVKGVLRSLNLTASHVRAEIDRTGFLPQSAEAQGGAGGKRQRVDSVSSDLGDTDPRVREGYAVAIRKLAVVLELLQYKKNIGEEHKLVEPLFECLGACVDLADAQDQATLEYIKQLILLAMAEIVGRMPRGGSKGTATSVEAGLNMELVVQCMRVTDNPQTHHHALILLAAVAQHYPERVLHNIMSVFTFMGTNVMRQDDNYTFHVIKQSIETIIPPLLHTHGRPDSPDTINTVLEVIKTFVGAFQHIPQHRRQPLYSHLVTVLGPGPYLGPCVMLLLARLARHKAEDTEQSTQIDEDVEGTTMPLAEFCLTLSQSFAVEDQLSALIATATTVAELPNTKPSAKEEKHLSLSPITRGVFDLRGQGDKALRRFKQACLDFVGAALCARPFVVAAHKRERDQHGPQLLQEQYRRLLEHLLAVVRSVATHMARLATDTKQPSGRGQGSVWRIMQESAYAAIDHLNSLLPLDAFVGVIGQLVRHTDSGIRHKALVLFNSKLEEQRESLSPAEVALFVRMAASLVDIIAQPDTDDQSAVAKQTALLNLEILARNFGGAHPKPFTRAVASVVDASVLGPSTNPHVRASGLVCLATLVGSLGPRMVPNLPKFMGPLIQMVQDGLDANGFTTTSVLHLHSALTALLACCEHLPQFLAPYLPSLIHVATHPMFTDPRQVPKEATAPGRKAQLAGMATKAESIRAALSTRVAPRLLLPALYGAWAQWAGSGPTRDVSGPLVAVLDMLAGAIGTADRPTVTTHLKGIYKFLLDSFEYRGLAWAKDVGHVEGRAVSTFVALVLKLSETSFKPLFLRLVDWHAPADAELSLPRQLVFYRLLDQLAGTLRNISVPYFKSVVRPLVALLEASNQARMLSGRMDKAREQAVPQLLIWALGALHKCFLYDTDHVVTREIFDEVMAPLVDQLENSVGGEDVFEERVGSVLVPCIAQMAVAVSDEEKWKRLNHAVLLKTRHDEMQVRAAALRVEKEMYERLGEEFLILLPETIPFLAESMEDDAVEVEQLTQEVIATIEKYLGESLQQYF